MILSKPPFTLLRRFGTLTTSYPVFAFLVLLLVLAVRQHRAGTKHVWVLPVTMISWFGRTGRPVGKLPAPATHRSRSQSRRPTITEKEKPRANFFPEAKKPRPRSRSFSGFDSSQLELIVPEGERFVRVLESLERNGLLTHGAVQHRRREHHLTKCVAERAHEAITVFFKRVVLDAKGLALQGE